MTYVLDPIPAADLVVMWAEECTDANYHSEAEGLYKLAEIIRTSKAPTSTWVVRPADLFSPSIERILISGHLQ